MRHMVFRGGALEPVTACFKKIQKIAQNDGNWKVYQWALSKDNTETDINIIRVSEFASIFDLLMIMQNFFMVKMPQSKRIFLKMDTKGYKCIKDTVQYYKSSSGAAILNANSSFV